MWFIFCCTSKIEICILSHSIDIESSYADPSWQCHYILTPQCKWTKKIITVMTAYQSNHVDGIDRQVDVVEQLAVVLDWHALINHSIHLHTYLSIYYLHVHVSTYTHLSIHPSIYLPIYLHSTYMYGVDRQVDVVEQLAVVLDRHAWINRSIHLHTYPSIYYLHVHVSTYTHLYPSIHPSIYPSIFSLLTCMELTGRSM